MTPRPAPADASTRKDTKTALLDAALQVFAELGYAKATIRDIADAAGANVAAVNYHFGDKLSLYHAVHEHARATSNLANPFVQQDTGRDFHANADPQERLFLFIRTMLDHIYADGEPSRLARLMLHEMVQPTQALDRTVEVSARRVWNGLQQITRDLAAPGTPPREVFAVSRSVILMIHGLHLTQPFWDRLDPGHAGRKKRDLDRLASEFHRFTLRALGRET